jgi:hypothetical protein
MKIVGLDFESWNTTMKLCVACLSSTKTDRITTLESALRQARDAISRLRRYGWHDGDCDLVAKYPESVVRRCTCGFDAALGDGGGE